MFLAGKFIHQGIDTTVAVLVVWVYLDTHHRTAYGVCVFHLGVFQMTLCVPRTASI